MNPDTDGPRAPVPATQSDLPQAHSLLDGRYAARGPMEDVVRASLNAGVCIPLRRLDAEANDALRAAGIPVVEHDPAETQRIFDEWWAAGAADRRADSLLYGTPEAEVLAVHDEPLEGDPR